MPNQTRRAEHTGTHPLTWTDRITLASDSQAALKAAKKCPSKSAHLRRLQGVSRVGRGAPLGLRPQRVAGDGAAPRLPAAEHQQDLCPRRRGYHQPKTPTPKKSTFLGGGVVVDRHLVAWDGMPVAGNEATTAACFMMAPVGFSIFHLTHCSFSIPFCFHAHTPCDFCQ